MLTLNDYFRKAGLEPNDIAVILHSPKERKLWRELPYLALNRPDVFEAYQASHGGPATRTLRGRKHAAAFVDTGDGSLLMVAAYQVDGPKPRNPEEIRALPAIQVLMDEYGSYSELNDPNPQLVEWFTLTKLDLMADCTGRLRIKPPMTQTYVRLAENLDTPVIAFERENLLSPAAPDWNEFIVDATRVRDLGHWPTWAARLREWRGVYLIVDVTDGARYVGSAYGGENLLGRWSQHIAGEFGITAELRRRLTRNFRFSILELVSPNALADQVVACENSWKERLGTRNTDWKGLNIN